MDATGDCDEAMDFLVDAIDKHNEESANKARDLIMSCNQKTHKGE
jgi:hypothetical protein